MHEEKEITEINVDRPSKLGTFQIRLENKQKSVYEAQIPSMASESGIWYFYFKGHGHGQGQKTLMIDLYIMVGYSSQNKVFHRSFFMPRIKMSCLFVCLSVFLSVINFNMRYKRLRLHIWHAHSTNNALSNDTKVNDLITMTDLRAKNSFFSYFVATGAIVFCHRYTDEMSPLWRRGNDGCYQSRLRAKGSSLCGRFESYCTTES